MIVGITPSDARSPDAQFAKTGLKTHESRSSGTWYGRCYRVGAERNHHEPELSLLNRVRSEFIEMPGLRLRIDQAQRLWNLDRAICESVLRSLVDAKFLGRFEDDLYARL